MNKKQQLRKYLDEQDMSWQILFGLCFLNYLGMLKENFEFDIHDAVKFCNDEQDFEAVYGIIDFLNFHEDEITDTLQQLHFKPISWQYDFIEAISADVGFKITQTLDRDALAIAYGYALLAPQIDTKAMIEKLDTKYSLLFQSAADKMRKLKRNFVLALECMLWPEDDVENMSFRELLALYIPKAGLDEVIKAYRHSLSPEVKLSSEERECLAFAYYSPFFYDEINIANGSMPEGSLFYCVENNMQEEKEFFARNRDYFEGDDNGDDEDDEEYSASEDSYDNQTESDEDDEIIYEDSAPFSHYAVYVDPLQRCVIDTMLCDDSYANVYIEKTTMDKFTEILPDFIRYNKGNFYTVEFVDNLKELDVAQKLIHNIASYETKIDNLNASLSDSHLSLIERYKLEENLRDVESSLSTCYFTL